MRLGHTGLNSRLRIIKKSCYREMRTLWVTGNSGTCVLAVTHRLLGCDKNRRLDEFCSNRIFIDKKLVLVAEHWTSSALFIRSLRVQGSLPNRSVCALWIWRRRLAVSLKASCEGLLQENGVRGPLLRAISVFLDQKKVVRPLQVGGEPPLQASLVLVHKRGKGMCVRV